MTKEPEYHVGCGMFGNIYAGTMAPPRRDGLKMWRNKSDVTDEAITAVMGHFITEMMRDDKTEIQKAWEVRGGKTLKVTFELSADKDGDEQEGERMAAEFTARRNHHAH